MKFAKYLQYLTDTEKESIADLVTRSGVDRSDLSKTIRGNRSTGSKLAGRIIGALKPEHQGEALGSWLEDQIPAECRGLVQVMRASENGKVRDEAPDVRTLNGAMHLLTKQAETNEAVRTVLMNMAIAFGRNG